MEEATSIGGSTPRVVPRRGVPHVHVSLWLLSKFMPSAIY